MIILPSYMGIDKPLESKDPLLTNQYVMVHFRRKCFLQLDCHCLKKTNSSRNLACQILQICLVGNDFYIQSN